MIDSSALVAILLGEPEAQRMVASILSAVTRAVGAPTLVEASAVMLNRKGREGELAPDALLQRLNVEVVPMSPQGASAARSAYARYGKGVGTPGVLNYGDCLAYGIAVSMGEPLLFKGDDFTRTDIPAVSY